MATSTGARDFPLQVYRFNNLTSTSSTTGAQDLVTAMNAVAAAIPTGPSVLQFGGGSVSCRCIVFVSKVNSTLGRAFTVGSYSYFDNLHIALGSNGWSLVT